MEIFGVISGIIYVFLEAKQNKLLWPLGIITSGVYIWVFYYSQFYADMGLQVYYVLISIYGWYVWNQTHPTNQSINNDANGMDLVNGHKDPYETKEKILVTHITLPQTIILSTIFVAIWVLLYFILKHFTDSTVPIGDSFTTALAIVATWMLTRKLIEQWYLWMIANFVSIVLYIYKGLYPTVVLYVVYVAMSFYGYYEWKKSMKNAQDEG